MSERKKISHTLAGRGEGSMELRQMEMALMITAALEGIVDHLDVDSTPVDGPYTLYVQVVPDAKEQNDG